MAAKENQKPRKPYVKPEIEEVTLSLEEAVLYVSESLDDSWPFQYEG